MPFTVLVPKANITIGTWINGQVMVILGAISRPHRVIFHLRNTVSLFTHVNRVNAYLAGEMNS